MTVTVSVFVMTSYVCMLIGAASHSFTHSIKGTEFVTHCAFWVLCVLHSFHFCREVCVCVGVTNSAQILHYPHNLNKSLLL